MPALMQRIRKWHWIAALVLAAMGAVLLAFGPGWLEAATHKRDGKPLAIVSREARALHKSLEIVDLHADTLMWKRSILDPVDHAQVDLPKLEQGNVALQLLSSVSKFPRGRSYDANSGQSDSMTLLAVIQLQPLRTWTSLFARSAWHARRLDSAVSDSAGRLVKIGDPSGLDTLLSARSKGVRTTGVMLTIEGLQNLEGKAENLDRLYQAGYRMAGLTHFSDNELAGSMHGTGKGGLTPFGRSIVRKMEDMGMIIDLAHCSQQCVSDVLAIARRPVISSHGGVQATCKVNRNLSDDQIRAIARTGGIIGIGYWPGAVCDISPQSIAKAMKHVRDLVGAQHLALGSDYDAATTVRFDTANLVQITQALIDAGFSTDEIRAVMGGNALRVIREGLLPYAQWRKDSRRG